MVLHNHCYCAITNDLPSVQQPPPPRSSFLTVKTAYDMGVTLFTDAETNTEHEPKPLVLEPSTKKINVSNASTQTYFSSRFCIEKIASDKKLIHFYTGFEDYEPLMVCFEFLGECVHGNLTYRDGKKECKQSQTLKGASRTLSPLNEFFLVLCRLRLSLFDKI